jgi:hypothetical protein
MNEENELTKILAGMGDSADAVAATLRATSIKGVRNSARFLNPIVRYCQSLLRLDDYALDLILRRALRMILPDGRKAEVQLPQPVVEFLDGFHAGKFPDLELSTS